MKTSEYIKHADELVAELRGRADADAAEAIETLVVELNELMADLTYWSNR